MKEDRPAFDTIPQDKAPAKSSRLVLLGAGAMVVTALALAWLWWSRGHGQATESPEMRVAQAAEVYRLTGDLGQAQSLLEGISANDLTRTFGGLELSAPDEATRQNYAVLRQVMGLPAFTPSLLDSLLNQNLLLITLVLATLPLFGAVIISLAPMLKRGKRPRPVKARRKPKADPEREQAPPVAAASPEPVRAGVAPTTTPSVETAPEPPVETDAGQPEGDPHIRSILSSVFEDETSAIKYEVLLRDLKELPANLLLTESMEIARELRTGFRERDGKEVEDGQRSE